MVVGVCTTDASRCVSETARFLSAAGSTRSSYPHRRPANRAEPEPSRALRSRRHHEAVRWPTAAVRLRPFRSSSAGEEAL